MTIKLMINMLGEAKILVHDSHYHIAVRQHRLIRGLLNNGNSITLVFFQFGRQHRQLGKTPLGHAT